MAFSAEEFEILSEKTLLFLIILDKNGLVLNSNKRCETLLNISKKEFIGRKIQHFLLDEDEAIFSNLLSKVCSTHTPSIQNLRFGIAADKGGILSLKFDFVYHDKKIYATGVNTTEENIEHKSLITLFNVTHTGSWHYNPSCKELFFSKELFQNLNLNIRENDLTFFKKEFFSSIEEAILAHVKKGVNFNSIHKFNFQKKTYWFRIIGEPVVHLGKIIYYNGTVSDITKYQEQFLQLKHNEETQKLALKGIRSGLFDHIIDTNMVFYSTDFKKMLGLPIKKDFIPEETFREMIHPDDVEEAFARHLENLDKDGHHYFNYYRLKHLQVGYRHYEIYGYRKKNKQGQTTRMIGNLIDVHQKKINENIIAENQRRLFAMINNGFTSSVLLDKQGKMLMADRSTLKIIKRDYGVNPSITPTKFIEVMPVNFKSSFAHEFNKALKGEIVKKEIQRITYRGATQWLEAKYTPIKNHEKEVISILLSFHDISEIKSAELKVKQAHIKEQELSDLKSNILSNFSHEIRTPLNGIITISNLLLSNETIKEDKSKLLAYLSESKDRLLHTMNSISSFSEIETIKKYMNFEEVDINYVVENSYRDYRHLAKAKNLTYILELDEECPTASFDEDFFSSALNNIINNAIKYTEKGTIKISIKTKRKSEKVHIIVKDTGIGISEDHIDSIFDPFIQESIGLSRKYEGTGIGLSLSKKYIELFGGTIKIKSKKNIGSEFIISIPLL